jgi:hypothetical protein
LERFKHDPAKSRVKNTAFQSYRSYREGAIASARLSQSLLPFAETSIDETIKQLEVINPIP